MDPQWITTLTDSYFEWACSRCTLVHHSWVSKCTLCKSDGPPPPPTLGETVVENASGLRVPLPASRRSVRVYTSLSSDSRLEALFGVGFDGVVVSQWLQYCADGRALAAMMPLPKAISQHSHAPVLELTCFVSCRCVTHFVPWCRTAVGIIPVPIHATARALQSCCASGFVYTGRAARCGVLGTRRGRGDPYRLD